jgi:hypothetical protein
LIQSYFNIGTNPKQLWMFLPMTQWGFLFFYILFDHRLSNSALFRCTLSINDLDLSESSNAKVDVVGCICAFLYVTFNTFSLEQIMIVLAYRTETVPALWNFIKWCLANRRWQLF